MNIKFLRVGAALVTLLLTGPGALAGDEKPKIEQAAAEKTALSRVPGGRVVESELEKEHGKLVWSFDIQQPASPNIIEVQVDAMTGEVVAMETETGDDQAKEAAKPDTEHK
jgi:hypothetical protein